MVTDIVQNHFGNRLEQLPGHYGGFQDIDKKCHEITNMDGGKSIAALMRHYGATGKISKSVNEAIAVRMFGGKSKKMNQIELFRRFGIIGKSITITKNGNRTEDMKLVGIDFDEWTDMNLSFEESFIYDYFANHQILCMLFEEESAGAPLAENKFAGFKRVSFTEDFIQTEVREVWEEVRSLIAENRLKESIRLDKNGKPIINKKTNTVQTELNFPKSKEHIIFIRGGGQDASMKTENVNGIQMYRQYVWIKGSYIVDMLSNKALI